MRLEYFEMVDHVEELDLDGGTIRAYAKLPVESPVFERHFPEYPILPGVLMLEIMNQTAGFMLYLRFRRERFIFLGSVRRARFRRMVKPGSELDTRAKILSEGHGFFVAETSLTVAGELAADAEIVLIGQDFPTEGARQTLAEMTSVVTFSEQAQIA